MVYIYLFINTFINYIQIAKRILLGMSVFPAQCVWRLPHFLYLLGYNMKNLSQKKPTQTQKQTNQKNKQTNKKPKAKQKTEDDHYEDRTCDYKAYSVFSSDLNSLPL